MMLFQNYRGKEHAKLLKPPVSELQQNFEESLAMTTEAFKRGKATRALQGSVNAVPCGLETTALR